MAWARSAGLAVGLRAQVPGWSRSVTCLAVALAGHTGGGEVGHPVDGPGDIAARGCVERHARHAAASEQKRDEASY